MARILLIDEPDGLETCAPMLEDIGHTCMSVSRGVDALRCMATQRPDLVVLNPHLSECEGIRTLEAIKEFDSDVCVMLYAGASLYGDSFDYFLADGTIAKQPDHSQLASFVREKFAPEPLNHYAPFHEHFF